LNKTTKTHLSSF